MVTGGGGTVGQAVTRLGEQVGVALQSLPHAALDVTDRAAVRHAIEQARPSAVIHLAALTSLERCELERQSAVAVNVMGTEHVAEACRATNAHLIYVSTGGVFGGWSTDGPFHELDVPKPANWYAATKLAGERAVERVPDHAIVRAGWIVGGGANDPKFVGLMVRAIQEGRDVRAVSDRLGTLTFADELAQLLIAVARSRIQGVWHFASEGIVSRRDIAAELVRLLNADVAVEPVPHTAFPSPAPRGRSEALTSVRPFGDLPRPSEWREGLRKYVAASLNQSHSRTST